MKHLHDISCVFQGFEGVGAIYISGISIAKNVELLKKHNIKAVICAARSGYVQYDQNIISQYLYIAADDNEQFNLSQYFLKAYEFIDINRKKTNVLVHCMAGISRSATIILAYLIKKYGYSVDMVLSLMKRKRPIIQPNQGFMIQLRDFSNIHNQKQHTTKTNFRRVNHQDIIHSCQPRKINSSNQKRQKKRQLSTFSKQFLIDLQKEKAQRKNIKSFRHLNKFQEQMKMNSQFLQRDPKTEQLKSNFYSEELGQELNVIQVKSEIKQLSEQHLLNQNQQPLSIQNNNQKQKPSISIAEKLDKIKLQLMKQYKKTSTSNKQLQNSQIQNQEQISFGALMANKIIRGGKPRRLCQKVQKQKKQLLNLQ